MISRNAIVIFLLTLFTGMSSYATEPLTIPPEIVKHMKKGRKLEMVWTAEGFDETKGIRLGSLVNESEDEAKVALEYFPQMLRRLIRSDSPYVLNLAVVAVRRKSSSNGSSSAWVEVEGQILDNTNKVVAAFTGYSSKTIGGNENDNVRLAVRDIAFAINKDIFPAQLPVSEKSSEIIVPAAPAQAPVEHHQAPATAGIVIPPSSQLTPQTTTAISPTNAAPSSPSSGATSAGVSLGGGPAVTGVAASSSSNASPVPPSSGNASPAPVPVINSPTPRQAEPLASLIPPLVAGNMKRGPNLAKLWISPAFDRSLGFDLGEVRYMVDARNDGIDKSLPEALAGIVKKDAPYRLQLRIVELTMRTRSKGTSSVQIGVEGNLAAKDGVVVAAFTTRESVMGVGDLTDDCRSVTRKVVLAIRKDLQ